MKLSKLITSFVFIISLFLLTTTFIIYKMYELSDNTKKIYSHPFTVINSIREIETLIISMHRNMKDIVLSRSNKQIIELIESTQHLEDLVYVEYKTIFRQYLGNKDDITLSYNTFKAWKSIRKEVLDLVYNKQINDAAEITKNKGAKHVTKLLSEINILKKFALNMANNFYLKSLKNNGIKEVSILFFVAIVLSSIIIFYIIHSLLKINQKNKEQLYMIDQNILTAKLDLKGKIINISNALCRIFHMQKESVLSTNSNFFVDEEQFKQFQDIIFSGKDYQGEISKNINGHVMWFKIEIFPIHDSNYNLKYFNLFLNNITDKKVIEEVSIKDSLSGLYNRNYFEMIFAKEIRRAKRDNKKLSMMMIDIDYFKQYNDTYGHTQGDKALKAVSDVLFDSTNRSYDYAFRVGGEEFVILCYNDSLEHLLTFASSIKNNIEHLQMEHKSSKVSQYLTISAGVMIFNESHRLSPEEMYQRVDTLLYKAKDEGRNRIIGEEL